MSEPRPFGDNLALAVRKYLTDNQLTSLGQINAELLADIAERYYEHHQIQAKARKARCDATPQELAIYHAYPRKVGRDAALRAIAVALRTCGGAELLEKVSRFARCVARWPASYRFKEGSDMCPHPATWFNAGRYADDEKEWLPAGMFQREDDPRGVSQGVRTVVLVQLAEPAGWREAFPDCIHATWQAMPEDSKRHIVKSLKA